MPFISVLGKPNKELTVHEAVEFHSRLYFMPGLPTPLFFQWTGFPRLWDMSVQLYTVITIGPVFSFRAGIGTAL